MAFKLPTILCSKTCLVDSILKEGNPTNCNCAHYNYNQKRKREMNLMSWVGKVHDFPHQVGSHGKVKSPTHV